MTNIKITDLTAYTDAASTDVLPIVDVVADVTKKIAISDIVKAVPQGTAALPGLAFDGDPDTGIYSPGADQIALVTAGTGRLFVNSTGTIQTNSAGQIESWSSAGSLTLYGGATSKGGGIKLNGGVADGNIIFYAQQQTATPAERLRITSTGTLMHIGAGNYITPAVQFNGSAPVDSLVVNSSGNVSTVGTMTADSFIPTSSTVPTNGVYLPSANNVAISTGGSGRLFINSTGSVSVGTTTAQSLFHLSQNALADLRFTDPGEATDQKNWVFQTGVGIGTGTFRLRAINDANSSGENAYLITRSGASIQTHQWLTAGSERMRLDSSGRLGLGTSSPAYQLDLGGGTTVSSRIQLQRGSDDTNQHMRLGWSGIDMVRANVALASSQTSFSLRQVGSDGTRNCLHVDSSGRVGIGSTDFGGKLTVKTSSSNGAPTTWGDGQFVVTAGDGTTAPGFGISTNTSDNSVSLSALTPGTGWNTIHYRAASHIFYRSDAASNEVGRFDTSGRFLVGTSSARSVGGGTGSLIHENINEGRPVSFVTNTNTIYGQGLAFGKSRGTSLGSATIVQSGDTLGYLDFCGADGTDLNSLAATISAQVDGTPGANDMPGRLVFSTTADGASSPTQSMIIYSDGEVQIARTTAGIWVGTTIDGAYRIGRSSYAVSSGTLYIGNAAIQVSSDVRLKKDIEDTSLDALDAISKIKVKDFTWDDPTDTSYNNRNARGKWTGLIAQELVDVLPFVVNAPRKEEDGSIDHESEARWTLDQSQLCPVLIKAIQQQQEIIAGLEARLSALEAS